MKTSIEHNTSVMNEIRKASGAKEIIAEDWRKYRSGARITYLVVDDSIRGYCAMRERRGTLRIDSLIIHPNWRNLGGGSMLLREAEMSTTAPIILAQIEFRDEPSDSIDWLSARGYSLIHAGKLTMRKVNRRTEATIDRIRRYIT